jgi:pimeloyl-ACP methyl ester carboxylesterase
VWLFAGPLCSQMGRFSDSGVALVQHVGMGQRSFRMIETNGITLRVVVDLRGTIVLDGAGHWLPVERTKEVNSALLAFLRGLDTS